MGLERLFEAELRFQPNMSPVVPAAGREGELVGSGDGSVRGPAVKGTIKWSNFETPGERLCGMYPAGVIETTDGATVRFEASGYALRSGPSSSRWNVGGAMRFETSDARYAWLEEQLGIWEGEFDESTGEATWRVYGSAVAAAA